MALGVKKARGDYIERQTLTVEEAARVLGISRSSAYEAVRRGELPVVKLGRRYLLPKAALERFLIEALPTPTGARAREHIV
jgi:excisionase family DNA binding protein